MRDSILSADENWYFSDSQFLKEGFKSNFKYFALFNYYPKNRFPELGQDNEDIRNLVWSFKDGYEAELVAKLIASAMKNQFPNTDFTKKTLCIIPASSQEKTTLRFERFCQELSRFLNMGNGFDLIRCDKIHEETKGDTKKQILKYLSFDEEKIKGCEILLFDDVKTTGKSFLQCASELKRLGALNVVGVFLAETISLRKKFASTSEFEYEDEHWQEKPDDDYDYEAYLGSVIDFLSPTLNERGSDSEFNQFEMQYSIDHDDDFDTSRMKDLSDILSIIEEKYPSLINFSDSIIVDNILCLSCYINNDSNYFILYPNGELKYKTQDHWDYTSHFNQSGFGNGIAFIDLYNYGLIKVFYFKDDLNFDNPIGIPFSSEKFIVAEHEERTHLIYLDNFSISSFGGTEYKIYEPFILFFPYSGYSSFNTFAIVDTNTKKIVNLNQKLSKIIEKDLYYVENGYLFEQSITIDEERKNLIYKYQNNTDIFSIELNELFNNDNNLELSKKKI